MTSINEQRTINRDKEVGHHSKRSPHWPAVEHEHLKQFPTCAACGGTEKLNVHHMHPFHLFPERELDPTNLLTLCMGETDCHILIGHSDNFKLYNPNVQEDAAYILAHRNNLKEVILEVAAKAKLNVIRA